MSDIAVTFRDVTKQYRFGAVSSGGVKNFLLHLPTHLKGMFNRSSFRALDSVSFEVKKGECLGVIGNNGSGKSTTLGLIAGVLRPTRGTVDTDGQIAPLLELGAGFHPELSGRDNIILNGVLLGMTLRQVREKMDDIIAFSELGEFIEHPIRVYSSGMVMRLGFAVAVHIDPDILLVDEVLAVGDREFQEKCLKRMEEFRSHGVTMVFVSHDLGEVERISDRVALLNKGCLVELGAPGETVEHYRRHFHGI